MIRPVGRSGVHSLHIQQCFPSICAREIRTAALQDRSLLGQVQVSYNHVGGRGFKNVNGKQLPENASGALKWRGPMAVLA